MKTLNSDCYVFIKACVECANAQFKSSGWDNNHWWRCADKEMVISDINSIPSFCSLKDAHICSKEKINDSASK